eukprot:c1793_g1_i1.p1 GENE.c1793_g1_i1~~c1793_g1_i1.p1  ORF type:complete len:240 (+),score=43.50 c1793_g1_i1:38-721(+)
MVAKGTKGRTRNSQVINGLTLHSKSKMFQKTGRKYIKNKLAKKVEKLAPKTSPRFYPVDEAPKPLARSFAHKAAKLRSSITPGTVLIVLTGPYRGKRVVFLKQLKSGLLLVTGPYKLNGVPLRRINQAYVIATSTKVGDVSKVDVSDVNDDLFKKAKKEAGKKKSEDKFFESKDEDKKKAVPDSFKQLQKRVDGALLPLVKSTEYLKSYLQSTFSLSHGQYPHLLKF